MINLDFLEGRDELEVDDPDVVAHVVQSDGLALRDVCNHAAPGVQPVGTTGHLEHRLCVT